jgi:hypothetical protein
MLSKTSLFVLLTLIVISVPLGLAEKAYSKGLGNRVFKITIDKRYHHLGDNYIDDFIVPEHEGTYWETSFKLPKFVFKFKDIALVKFLAHQVDLTNLIINGHQIPLQDTHTPDIPIQLLFTYAIPLPLDLLEAGENTIGFEVTHFGDGNWDDMEFGGLEIWFQ